MGYFYGIHQLGLAIGIFDIEEYSNTPQRKSNFAWWKDVIKTEAKFIVWKKKY